MKQNIQVEARNKYGTPYFYPLNKEAKEAINLFGNRKSLSLANIEALKKMGFVIEQMVMAGGKAIKVGVL